ncbi:hypothetical protein Afil01_45250 [Actinorhabdospora filicis]|uniref:Uncharacterized protein n=1 Tax=Actinorhabdospora filicis TaxID=1785913 RepID=A0A9W6WB48_9ACTN|nr:hypothetical protein [Actinorhabdospora filicis]GLZ79718.1 hypothetical protein Afil01_45250 [Actinorhabdospora filicis]
MEYGIAAAIAVAALAAIAALTRAAARRRGWVAARPGPSGLSGTPCVLRLDGGKTLTVHANGFAKTYPGGHGTEWALWTQVDDVEVLGTGEAVAVQLLDGTRIFLCGGELAAFAAEAREIVTRLRLNGFRTAVAEGGTVTVGRLTADAAGLRRGRHVLPWAVVEGVDADGEGRVRFRTAEGAAGWAGFRALGPRDRAFLALARELAGQRADA